MPVEVKFEVTYEGGRRAITPVATIGEPSVLDPEQRRPVQRLTVAQTGSGPLAVAQLGPLLLLELAKVAAILDSHSKQA